MVNLPAVKRQVGDFLATQKTRLENIGFAGGAGIISAAMSIVALALNTRGLQKEDFGALVAIQAYVALCATICSMESWQCICRLAAEKNADMLRICRKTIVLDMIAAVAAFALAAAGIFLIGSLTGLPAMHLDLALIYSLSLLAGITGTARGFFRFYDRFDVIAANTVLNSVLLVIVSFALWYFEAPLAQYVYALAAVAIIAKLQLVTRLYLHLRRFAALPHAEPISFGRIARMSFSVSLLSTVTNGRKNLAILAATWFLGASAAGLIGAAFRCTTPLTYATELLKQVLFSDTIKAFNRPTISQSALRKLTFASLGMLLLALVGASIFALFAEPIVGLVLDPDYIGAAPVLGVLLFSEGLHLAAIIFLPVFQARKRTNLLTFIHVASLAGFIAVVYLLGSGIDATTFAFVFAACYLVIYVVQYILVLGPGGFARREAAR